MIKEHIKIWRFTDEPKKFSKLSENGGDEDWVAFIPTKYLEDYLAFLEEGTPFGCCTVEKHKVKDGEIWIGCHA